MKATSQMPPARVIIPIVLACMCICLALAFLVDCVRLDRVARSYAIQADEELLALEQRYAESLNGQNGLSPQATAALDAYDLTKNSEVRHQAFRELCQAVNNKDAPQLPTGLSDRLRGLENRWTLAYQAYEAEVSHHQNFRQTLRGRVAAWVWDG